MPDILSNPKARRDYHILDTFEAGIVLHGTEVKALRAGQGQIRDAFARVENNEVFRSAALFALPGRRAGQLHEFGHFKTHLVLHDFHQRDIGDSEVSGVSD